MVGMSPFSFQNMNFSTSLTCVFRTKLRSLSEGRGTVSSRPLPNSYIK